MSWQTALALFFVALVSRALLQRSYSQRSKLPESFPPAISNLLGLSPLGIIVGLALRHHIHWSWWLVFLLVAEGIFIGLYNWLSFQAIRRLQLARFQTIYQSYEIVTIVLGWTLLGEGLTYYQMLGGVLLLVAAWLAISAPKSVHVTDRTGVHAQAVLLASGSAMAVGIGLVTEKAALRHMDMGAFFIVGYATQTVTLLVLAAKDINRKTLRLFRRYDFNRSLAMGVLNASIGFFYVAAIVKSNNISLITALGAAGLPLTALAGYIFLREREDRKLLWTAIGLSFAGLLVTTL